jgi:Tfp pilus assembly protein FimT
MEICIALVIIGIVGAMVLSTAGNQGLGAETAARTLAADLRYARTHAVTYRTTVTVTFDDPNVGYVISGADGNALTHPVTQKPYRVYFDAGHGFAGVASTNDFADDELTFSSTGTPSASGSCELLCGSNRRTVKVRETTGNVYVTNP